MSEQKNELEIYHEEGPWSIKVPSDGVNNFQQIIELANHIGIQSSPESLLHQVAMRSKLLAQANCLFHTEVPIHYTKEGKILLYHVTRDLDLLRTAILQDTLKDPPKPPKWSSRCFSPGLFTFTDERLARPLLTKGATLVSFEAEPPQEIIFRQEFIKSQALKAIHNLPLNAQMEFSNLVKHLVEKEPNILDSEFQEETAFQLSGLVIDALCVVFPEQSRISLRIALQGYISPSGYRGGTDLHYSQKKTLLGALSFITNRESNPLDERQKQHIAIIRDTLVPLITTDPQQFTVRNGWDIIDGKYIPNDTVGTLVAERIFNGTENPIKIRALELLDTNGRLIQTANGWYPLDKFQPKNNTSFGTDGGSNNIVVVRHIDMDSSHFTVVKTI